MNAIKVEAEYQGHIDISRPACLKFRKNTYCHILAFLPEGHAELKHGQTYSIIATPPQEFGADWTAELAK